MLRQGLSRRNVITMSQKKRGEFRSGEDRPVRTINSAAQRRKEKLFQLRMTTVETKTKTESPTDGGLSGMASAIETASTSFQTDKQGIQAAS